MFFVLSDTVQPRCKFGGLSVLLHFPPFWHSSFSDRLLRLSLRVYPGTCGTKIPHHGRKSDGLLLGDWRVGDGATGLLHPGLENFAARSKLSTRSVPSLVDVSFVVLAN